MPWEVCRPKSTTRLSAGEAGVSKVGAMCVSNEDLAAAGIMGTRVILEFDREERRLSLREPPAKSWEGPLATLTPMSKNSSRVGISSALAALGVEAVSLGRLKVVTSPERLIVLLPKGSAVPVAEARKRAKPIRGGGQS